MCSIHSITSRKQYLHNTSCNHHLPSCSRSESPDFVSDTIQGSRQLNCCWWLYILFLIITIILFLRFLFLLLCKVLSPSSQKETYMHHKNLVLRRKCRKGFIVQYAIKNVHNTFQIWGKSVAQTRKTTILQEKTLTQSNWNLLQKHLAREKISLCIQYVFINLNCLILKKEKKNSILNHLLNFLSVILMVISIIFITSYINYYMHSI